MQRDGITYGGAEGIRTPDPLLAKQVLYQLSYSPTGYSVPPAICILCRLANH